MCGSPISSQDTKAKMKESLVASHWAYPILTEYTLSSEDEKNHSVIEHTHTHTKPISTYVHGNVAQLAESSSCMQRAVGSIPSIT